MAKYLANRETWLSHECRLVKEGEVFETELPPETVLDDNLTLIVDPPVDEKKAK
jgi:hypothetical protein